MWVPRFVPHVHWCHWERRAEWLLPCVVRNSAQWPQKKWQLCVWCESSHTLLLIGTGDKTEATEVGKAWAKNRSSPSTSYPLDVLWLFPSQRCMHKWGLLYLCFSMFCRESGDIHWIAELSDRKNNIKFWFIHVCSDYVAHMVYWRALFKIFSPSGEFIL